MHKKQPSEYELIQIVSYRRLLIEAIIHSLASQSLSGFNGVSTKNLKLIYPYIAAVLLIINKSFESDIFPEFLKIACVIALHKDGDVDQLVNFRPISLLCSLSKVFERAICLTECFLLSINMTFCLILSLVFVQITILCKQFHMHLILFYIRLMLKCLLLVYISIFQRHLISLDHKILL